MPMHTFDLAEFKRSVTEMVSKNESSWNRFGEDYIPRVKEYTLEEIQKIIDSSSLASQQKLSRNYYDKNGFYKRILLHYATLLTYSSLLIPNPSFGKQLSNSYIEKRYHMALEYVDKMHLEELFTRMSLRALIDGCYYGIIQNLTKNDFVIFDLPATYCRSNYRDIYGNDIVEFNVGYFNTIVDQDLRTEALNTYPKIVSAFYKKYMAGKAITPWVKIPAEVGICFPFSDDGRPLFLSVIPATIQYDQAVDTENERELEEIRKIIVQKIPHLQDGTLLFEPPEAAEMHKGAVGMMKGNKNISVLTTYADVDSIVSKTAAENASSALEKMRQNIYSEGGTSAEIFAPTGSQALPISIINDINLMMILGNKYSRFVSHILNTLYGNGNLSFSYQILPVTLFTQRDYIDSAFKLAQSGYSFLVPAVASGIKQSDFSNLKVLENDILKLGEILKPLSSTFNQSNSQGEAGAPEKRLEDKSPKTIQNEDALNNQGGSNG